MARNDGIDRTFARNQDLPTLDDVAKVQEHNEREKDSYSNQDIDTTQTYRNIHFKAPTDSYAAMFDQMIADGVISTRGLKADAVKYGELIFDVNSAYFHNHGGYEYAKQFYTDAYKAAVEIVGGEQYILSAVMHADERNRAMSEALGQDVYHYHLHVVYVPVVEKQILWSKRCKDKSLVGTVKETIMQVSRSKKWESKVALDEQGNPLLTSKGKKVLRTSYSVLQDDFFNYMKAAGYTDVERGERGSTEEHLTVTQFKVAQEQQRLEDVTAQIAQTEQALDTAQAAVEKKHKELQSLQKQAKEQRTAALTVQEIRSMGKKTITGNITLTPSECNTLKDYAVNGILAKAENSRLEEKLQQAQKSVAVWKQRYELLKEQARPYLEAVKLAPERIGGFVACAQEGLLHQVGSGVASGPPHVGARVDELKADFFQQFPAFLLNNLIIALESDEFDAVVVRVLLVHGFQCLVHEGRAFVEMLLGRFHIPGAQSVEFVLGQDKGAIQQGKAGGHDGSGKGLIQTPGNIGPQLFQVLVPGFAHGIEFKFQQVGQQNPVFTAQHFAHFAQQFGNPLHQRGELRIADVHKFAAQHAHHGHEVAGHVQQVLEQFQRLLIVAPAEQAGHPAAAVAHHARHLEQFVADVERHFSQGDGTDFHGAYFVAFDVLGLVGINFGELFVVEQHVGDDAVFAGALGVGFHQDFFQVGEVFDMHVRLAAVDDDHDIPPVPREGK